MKLRNTLTGLMLIVLSVLLSGCGSKNTQAPPTGSIVIAPSSFSWAVSVLPAVYTYQSELTTITVKGSDGVPLSGISVSLTLDLSPSTSTSPAMGMYLTDPIVNGTVDPNAVLLPASVTMKTDSSGNVQVWLLLATGNGISYKGNLSAVSGSLGAQANITVTCTSSGTTTCP